jgi:hypothetical protein
MKVRRQAQIILKQLRRALSNLKSQDDEYFSA